MGEDGAMAIEDNEGVGDVVKVVGATVVGGERGMSPSTVGEDVIAGDVLLVFAAEDLF